MTAISAMGVIGSMAIAIVSIGAFVRIHRTYFKGVLVDVTVLQIVEIARHAGLNMVVVFDGSVIAVGGVFVDVIVMNDVISSHGLFSLGCW